MFLFCKDVLYKCNAIIYGCLTQDKGEKTRLTFSTCLIVSQLIAKNNTFLLYFRSFVSKLSL